MATDYILFVHGVNTRNPEELRERAEKMFERIIKRLPPDPNRPVKPIIPYWGNVSQTSINQLRQILPLSPAWNGLWLRKIRLGGILDFIGDGTLYLSRHVGFEVVEVMLAKVMQEIQSIQPGDRLHLVTHSWGSVILFDVLFAKRWESPGLPEQMRQTVAQIRNALLGLGDNPQSGIPIASIYTMGSPIAIFNLINQEGSGHSLTKELNALLQALYQQHGCPLPWLNFIHPGDFIAYPLEGLVAVIPPDGTRGDRSLAAASAGKIADQTVNLQDTLVRTRNLLDILVGGLQWLPIVNGLLAIPNLGFAHGCYWKCDRVDRAIAQTIHQSRQHP